MRKFFIYLSNRHEMILKMVIILMTIGIIITLLPHKVRYKFDFQKGKSWNNKDLVAPFDFAIKKNPDSIKVERAEALRSALPHFRLDSSVYLNVLNDFESRLNTDSTSLSAKPGLLK